MFWAQFPEIQRELDKVQEVILREVSGAGGTVAAALRDLATRDAKLLRPGCTILAARLQTGGRRAEDRIIRIAAAVEMLHMASLVHDDIVDGAARRRGGDAIHVTYGSRDAVLMGDYLFARCFSLMADDASPRNAATLSKVVSHVISAEIEESAQAGSVGSSVRTYLRRIVGKTAILFALSFHLGAAEAGGDEAVDTVTVEVLRRIGYCLGMSFQILDDLLDLFGDPGRTGKPIGTDLRQGIITLPIILALDSGRHARLSGLLARLARSRRVPGAVTRSIVGKTVSRVQREVMATGAEAHARRIAERYSERARREILRLPESTDRDTLSRLTSELLQRVS